MAKTFIIFNKTSIYQKKKHPFGFACRSYLVGESKLHVVALSKRREPAQDVLGRDTYLFTIANEQENGPSVGISSTPGHGYEHPRDLSPDKAANKARGEGDRARGVVSRGGALVGAMVIRDHIRIFRH